jgi:hypothetical protein
MWGHLAVGTVLLAVVAACGGGPYTRQATEAEVYDALNSDGKATEIDGVFYRHHYDELQQIDDLYWCFTGSAETLTPGDPAGWVAQPPRRGCVYADVDLHPPEGEDPVRIEVVPKVWKERLKKSGKWPTDIP